MEALLLAVMGMTNIVCFVVGAKVGQKVKWEEPIETPTINPMKVYKEREAKKEAQMEQDKIDTIMRNIERYDGTSQGQEDVSGRW